MPGRPLEYDSLKAVLRHLEANLRFQIFLRMPLLRNVDKILPLKIKHLSVKEFSTIVNNTTYRLGVYQHYPTGKVPEPIKENNSCGGSMEDFDEFGFSTLSGYYVRLPGDVSYRDENGILFRTDTDEVETQYRQSLRTYEIAKERYTELKKKGLTVKEYLNSLEPLEDNIANHEESVVRHILKYSSTSIDWDIEYYQTKLVPFDCRRNNSKPPFTCYIQLTITKGKEIRIQRFEYNRKLFEAVKQLNQVLFGGRSFPIYVSNFDILTPTEDTYRLPIGFRLKVKTVHSFEYTLYDENFQLIVKNSDCLSTLWINSRLFFSPYFQNPTVLNSKELIIVASTSHEIQGFTRMIKAVRNLNVSFKSYNLTFSPEEYYGLYHSWLSGNRPIGAMCCIGLEKEETGREVLKLIGTRNEKTKRTKRCVTVQKNATIRLEVFYVPFRSTERCYHDLKCNWILKMRMVKVN